LGRRARAAPGEETGPALAPLEGTNEIADLHSEAGEEVAAVYLVVGTERPGRAIRLVYHEAWTTGIESPNGRGSTLEPIRDLFQDFGGRIVRRDDLDGEVRCTGEVGFRDAFRWDALGAYDRDVRCEDPIRI